MLFAGVGRLWTPGQCAGRTRRRHQWEQSHPSIDELLFPGALLAWMVAPSNYCGWAHGALFNV